MVDLMGGGFLHEHRQRYFTAWHSHSEVAEKGCEDAWLATAQWAVLAINNCNEKSKVLFHGLPKAAYK